MCTETKLLTSLLLKAQAVSKKREGRIIAQERGLDAARVSEDAVHSIAKGSLQLPCSTTPYAKASSLTVCHTTVPCVRHTTKQAGNFALDAHAGISATLG